jgi:hypothetical protein
LRIAVPQNTEKTGIRMDEYGRRLQNADEYVMLKIKIIFFENKRQKIW